MPDDININCTAEYDEPDSYWLEYYEEAAFYGE